MAHNLSERICQICNTIYKPTSNKQKVCINCKSILRQQSVDKCSKEAHARDKEKRRITRQWYENLSLEKKAIRYTKSRAKQLGIEFNLTPEDIIFPDICPILNKHLQRNETKGPSRYSPSIDRIDNDKGYTVDNIQIISMKANTMKCDASVEELQRFADWVIKTYPR